MNIGQTVVWNGDGIRHSDLIGFDGVVRNVVGLEALVAFGVSGTNLERSGGHKILTLTCWCPTSGLSAKDERQAEWE